MNKKTGVFVTSLAATVLLLAAAAPAQTAPRTVKASIPFAFGIAGQDFPAGDYTFAFTANFMSMRDARGREILNILTGWAESTTPISSRLRFRDDNGRKLLVQIWPGDSRLGHELYPSRNANLLAKRKPLQTARSNQP